MTTQVIDDIPYFIVTREYTEWTVWERSRRSRAYHHQVATFHDADAALEYAAIRDERLRMEITTNEETARGDSVAG